jgi:6-phosphogluconolactonase
MSTDDTLLLFAGSQTQGDADGKGICLIRFETKTLRAEVLPIYTDSVNPTFLAMHPDGKTLYAVQETDTWDGNEGGAVVSYHIDIDEQGMPVLTKDSEVLSSGTYPCHLAVDPSGTILSVSNYGSGSAVFYRLAPDGRITEQVLLKDQHSGSGPVTERQEGPHMHSTVFDRSGTFCYSADLGTDRVSTYTVDQELPGILKHDELTLTVPAGSGPRHLLFGPAAGTLYLVEELSNEVTLLRQDPATGALRLIESYETLPEDFYGFSKTAEIRISADGKYLYCSNRGHESITRYAIDAEDGRLNRLGCSPCGGSTPRNFIIDPSDTFLFCANSASNAITVFYLDQL